MKLQYRLGILFLIFLSACGGKNFQEPGEIDGPDHDTDISFRIDYEKTWTAVENVMSRYPLVKKNKKKGVFETDWIYGAKSDLLYSGYGDVRIPYKIRHKFYLSVIANSPERSTVRISNQEQYWSDVITKGDDFQGTLYKWYDTESSTIKERKVLEKIDAELRELLKK
jgi:hypothetical protein